MKTMLKSIATTLIVALMFGLVPVVGFAAPPDSQFNRQGQDLQQGTERGFRIKDLANLIKALRNEVVGNGTVAGAGLTVATTAAQVKTTGPINYRINGAYYFKATTDNYCTMPTTPVLTSGQSAWFRFEIDTSGNCNVKAGPVVTATGTDKTIAVMPLRTASMATLGVVLIQGIAFTGNTTAMTASANIVYVNGDPDLIDLFEP